MKVGTENLSFHSFYFCKLKLTRDQQLIIGDRERDRKGIELFTELFIPFAKACFELMLYRIYQTYTVEPRNSNFHGN